MTRETRPDDTLRADGSSVVDMANAVLDRNPAGTHERNLALFVLGVFDRLDKLSREDTYSQDRGGLYLAGWQEALLVARELFDDR